MLDNPKWPRKATPTRVLALVDRHQVGPLQDYYNASPSGKLQFSVGGVGPPRNALGQRSEAGTSTIHTPDILSHNQLSTRSSWIAQQLLRMYLSLGSQSLGTPVGLPVSVRESSREGKVRKQPSPTND